MQHLELTFWGAVVQPFSEVVNGFFREGVFPRRRRGRPHLVWFGVGVDLNHHLWRVVHEFLHEFFSPQPIVMLLS